MTLSSVRAQPIDISESRGGLIAIADQVMIVQILDILNRTMFLKVIARCINSGGQAGICQAIGNTGVGDTTICCLEGTFYVAAKVESVLIGRMKSDLPQIAAATGPSMKNST